MATIKDVAKLAGVSPSTASRVLHGNPLISEKTQVKVRKAMVELNYSPDFNAQNLARKFSNNVGVILPVDQAELFDNPFFLEIVRGINKVFTENKMMLTVGSGENISEVIVNIDTMIKSGNIKNFILLYSEVNDPVINKLENENVNFVVVGKPSHNIANTMFVDNNNISCGEDATNFLLENGHENICFIYSNLNQIVQKDRLKGYEQALFQVGLEKNTLKEDFSNFSTGIQHINNYLTTHKEITAFVAVDDIMGLRVEQAVNVNSQIARPISVITFNNSLFSEIALPSLTTIEIYPEKLGEGAAELIVKCVKNKKERVHNMEVSHKIIERDSVTVNR
ncbi:LacI family DNA-binding transcriptional regulator [Pediococcus ethanolidurans]|uniref:LacI family DNA-binding transcriptional regulator n=1 Tax=Pediococcus ethanolidurans TaxID=319653 RepID=UPI0021AAF192|nr:LacI family DNA-binding transcriptional regulator [Pediococcus ethanolidurans]MCT4397297.1 LacI family DNA-binding transcriptional regulator [Pediococcus ethanolidurans]